MCFAFVALDEQKHNTLKIGLVIYSSYINCYVHSGQGRKGPCQNRMPRRFWRVQLSELTRQLYIYIRLHKCFQWVKLSPASIRCC